VTSAPSCVVFDLGGVLIDWNPRHLYRDLIADEAEMEWFLSEVCHQDWNKKQDAGRTMAEATAERLAAFPEHRHLIEAYYGQFQRMWKGAIPGSVDVLRELKTAGVPVYALTNWSAETMPRARELFDFLNWFDGMVVSGGEGVIKPDRAIFALLCERFGLVPAETVFIDDHAANIEAGRAFGLKTVLFTDPGSLREHLAAWEFPVGATTAP